MQHLNYKTIPHGFILQKTKNRARRGLVGGGEGDPLTLPFTSRD